MSKTVVGIFQSYSDAERAANQIKDAGLRTSDISIVAKQGDNINNTTTTDTNTTTATMKSGVNDNISDGVIAGGILGGLAGLLIGVGTMTIPGFGIIAAAGPVTGLLSGAVTGGIVGGLVDLGIPENKSRDYEKQIKSGKILWSMSTDNTNVNRVIDILETCGASDVEAY